MQNIQDAPLDETQTDSQLSTGGVEMAGVADLCDTASPIPQGNTPSPAPVPDKLQRNEIFVAAIEFLTNLSTEEAKSHGVHHFIEEAVDYITTFMDELLSTPSISPDYIGCITSLLSTSFAVQLFQLRAVFRGLAAQARPRTSANVTIISWVDDLLVKLCACILRLTTNGAIRDFNKRVGTRSVKSLQDNEARKAATQLPVKFTELPDALISKYSSPAMVRMALTLLYGTTVLPQRYKAVAKQKVAQQSNIEGLISVVSTCIIKHGVDPSSPSPACPLTLVEYAILVSLYAYGACLDVNLSFAPHIEHNVVGLVDLILDSVPSDSCLSTNTCLGPSSALTEDLSVVEWFWNRWGDGSTLLAATGLKLTRHWVQHYKPGATNRNQACIEVLVSRSPCSFQVLLHLVESFAPGALTPPPSSDEMRIIELVCEAYTALAIAKQPGDLRYEHILAEACKRLCPYMLISSPDCTARPIHKLLLDFLISVGPAVVRVAYGGASGPQSAHNPEQVMQEVMAIIERTGEDPEDQAIPGDIFHPTQFKYMLDFLAILLHSNACASSQVVLNSTFLPRLISWMSKPPGKRPTLEQAEWNMLQTSTLLLLGFACSHFKTCRSSGLDRFPEHEQDTFLEVVLGDGGDSLLKTCALARYMVATEDVRILDDPVVVLEVWSQIRDALLATLQRRFTAEQEPISVAVSGTLCASLVSILRTVGKQTRAMILASPWTQTLRVELEKAVVRGKRLDDFALGLCRQLEGAANTFVHETAGGAVGYPLEDSVHLVCVDVAGWLQIVPMFVAPTSQ